MQIAPAPARGNLKSIHEVLSHGFPMTIESIEKATGIDQHKLVGAIRAAVHRGYAVKTKDGRYKCSTEAEHKLAQPFREKADKPRPAFKQIQLKGQALSRVDELVAKRKATGKKATRSSVVHEAVLAFTRKKRTTNLTASVLVEEAAPKSVWWRFWE